MTDVLVHSVIEGGDPRAVFVAADAEIRWADQRLNGRLFIAARGGLVAVCASVASEYISARARGLAELAQRNEIGARIDIEDRNGLDVVTRLWLVAGGGAAWPSKASIEQLTAEQRYWWPAVTIASAAVGTRSTLPAPRSTREPGTEIKTINITGEIGIGNSTAERILALIGDPERCDHSIALNISSPGGNFKAALSIYRALAAWPYSVFANIKQAHSAAALIAIGGRRSNQRTGRNDAATPRRHHVRRRLAIYAQGFARFERPDVVAHEGLHRHRELSDGRRSVHGGSLVLRRN